MRFTYFIASGFAALVAAQNDEMPDINFLEYQNPFHIPANGLSFRAGESSEITWSPTTEGTVTIVLRSGTSDDLAQGLPVAEHTENDGSFIWDVPANITRGDDYALQIIADSHPDWVNYTPLFVIESNNTVATPTSDYTYGAETTSRRSLSSVTPSAEITTPVTAESTVTTPVEAPATGTGTGTGAVSQQTDDAAVRNNVGGLALLAAAAAAFAA
ncbi:Ser-Thr-rich glycosyl-phosphatidyl-inositol-anchored membrane family-domain-containing protein [Lineolata rhizophorae]|uniref:Ser-Thr-rich glycosyl-phosphatidyl-inositol-anchored membrane family-domain-containing protein n=1 Tax=Lineolata rhizophorae TaxID=578093 RepID=A0A6A6P757_9PEZI|nr:Ser-Thr-rich glycosyl-phosphatidyl-inositol-anchored membrane family-domain-containing protein [Lineolata rhizophorae]